MIENIKSKVNFPTYYNGLSGWGQWKHSPLQFADQRFHPIHLETEEQKQAALLHVAWQLVLPFQPRMYTNKLFHKSMWYSRCVISQNKP